jgi:hypothetical protein
MKKTVALGTLQSLVSEHSQPIYQEALDCLQNELVELHLTGWNKITDKLPPIGETVIVCFNGVVQHETYFLDCGDLPGGGVEHFWDRDGLDNGKIVANSDLWIPLPTAP